MIIYKVTFLEKLNYINMATLKVPKLLKVRAGIASSNSYFTCFIMYSVDSKNHDF